ncbi:diacylglycerol kinase [Thalassovita sp.]|uniref:diacylglycerol kinase n=1 Tax=Thalassovita sp. TaxID=1979401 RepID=UPI002B2710E1|nr:diacylglycerol kinase [Thalassovita sp.]
MLYFFKRLRLRVIWSWAGLAEVWRNEYSFRSWIWANIASAGLAFVLPLTGGERALILALGILVLAAELFNSAIERVVDDISKQERDLAKQAKDAGSAGVAVAAIAVGVAWVAVLVW